MIKLEVCIGSACHLKGSKHVVDTFERLIAENALADKIDLNGAFCMGNCKEGGVSVSINDTEIFSVTAESAEEFFKNEVMSRI